MGAEFKLENGQHEEIKARIRELLTQRIARQPKGAKSAGCVFKNPDNMSAGKMIDECGFKGLTIGGAQVSEVHANFIVNQGGATSGDITELMNVIVNGVREKFGLTLEPEVLVVGPCGEVGGHEEN